MAAVEGNVSETSQKSGEEPPVTAESLLSDARPPQAMVDHTKAFITPQIIKVLDGIYVALGYGLANSIWLEGPEGVVVVDTTESVESGRQVYQAMREFTKAPIKAIIYTHHHMDHTYGAEAFVEDPAHPPDVWAHSSLEWELDNEVTVGAIHFKRGMRQFGTFLPACVKSGTGLRLRQGKMTNGIIMPTKTVSQREEEVSIAGLSFRLLHVPGETDDHLAVWLGDKHLLICADDFYMAYPNVYAIRGTPMRNVRKWVESLDRMRKLQPRHLVPCHGRPIEGEKAIYETLTTYRDGLQYMHDQTVRCMNQDAYPEDIARAVNLPSDLTNAPQLQQRYGTVEWSTRSVFDQYLGWFNGDVTHLSALGTKETSERMIKLVGGPDKMIQAARQALEEDDAQWALTLATHVVTFDRKNIEARAIRLSALKVLAQSSVSPNGRHYYLTTALEDFGLVNYSRILPKVLENKTQHMTVLQLFLSMRMRLAPDRAEGTKMNVLFEFTDKEELWFAQLRHSILEVTSGEQSDWKLRVSGTRQVWEGVLGGFVPAMEALQKGDIEIIGDVDQFRTFFSCFDSI